jgi:voltage-gated potassium channel
MGNPTDRIARWLDAPMLFAALLSIPAIVIESSAAFGDWYVAALVIDWIVWSAFALELIVMIAVTPDRSGWLRQHPLEVAIVVLTPPFLPGPLQAARLFRLLRLLRLIRVVELSRRMFSLEGIRNAAVVTALVVVASGVVFASVEHGHGPHPNLTTWDGLWWAAATVMTVGPGDYAPVTVAGRAISLLVMTVGIGFVALLTAAAAQRFIKTTTDHRERSSAQILQRLDDVVERLDRLERTTGEAPERL